MNLKPCPFRHTDDEGHILCDKIKKGEREVTPNVCRSCPVAAINCAHLRATLDHQAHPPIVVRWGNGRTEVWDNVGPPIEMDRAACAEKVVPIHSQRDCAGCALRRALVSPEGIVIPTTPPVINEDKRRTNVGPRTPRTAPSPIAPPARPIAQPVMAQAPQIPNPEVRSSMVAQKIIQLQEWLAKQKTTPKQSEEDSQPTPIAMPQPARRINEERRTGWTD